jgi:glycosyltransferase involved in cell wall biosynthesis
MFSATSMNLDSLTEHIARLRRNPETPPDASIVVPVNAQGDLDNVLQLLADITGYDGQHALEIVLVINNYPPDAPPPQIEIYTRVGLHVVSIPNVRRPGEAVGFSARIPGIRAASSDINILFDADCRIPHPTAVIDWYMQQFKTGAQSAYTHVDYYDYPDVWSVRVQLLVHHMSRWVKRAIFRIPTTRGSNYAVSRSTMLTLYEKGMLADEMNVGPTFKNDGGKVVYSGSKDLVVLTSGRMFKGGWMKLFRYFRYRLRYNLRVLPVRSNVARYTQHEKDPIRRYINNEPLE